MHRQHQTRPVYGNCVMEAPDGTPMCRCDRKKTDWYTSRGLAVVVAEKPYTIRLTFEPQGRGHAGDPYYLSDKPLVCAVCGSEQRLTKHHCVPAWFRRNFPAEYKSHSSHDVVPLCDKCHDIYEKEADKLKTQIIEEMGLKANPSDSVAGFGHKVNKDEVRAMRDARTLSRSNAIPQARVEVMRAHILACLGHLPSEQEIDAFYNKTKKNHIDYGKQVAEKITDIDAFVRRWREHFVSVMRPAFLPLHWSVERPAKK